MELNRLTRDADDMIRKVVVRYNQLYIPPGSISQVELDLLLDDLRKLYETFKSIGQINLSLQNTVNKPEVKVSEAFRSGSNNSTADVFKQKPTDTAEPSVELPKPEPEIMPDTAVLSKPVDDFVIADEKIDEFIFDSNSKTDYNTESLLNDDKAFINQASPVQEVKEKEIAATINESKPSLLADKFVSGSKSLSETMVAVPSGGVVGSRLLFHPITDLSSGIGLNDKFSFISELFHNNSAQYEEAITRINKAVNLDEANWILQKYHHADWENKQESLARLKDFVKRRFI